MTAVSTSMVDEARERRTIAAVVIDYCRVYRPRTRQQIIRYLVRRHEFHYDLVQGVVNALFQDDRLTGVMQ